MKTWMLPWLVPVGCLGAIVFVLVVPVAAMPDVIGAGLVLAAVVFWHRTRRDADVYTAAEESWRLDRIFRRR